MGIYDLSGFNINEGETTDLVSAIKERFLSKPSITAMHQIVTGVTYNQLIPFVGVLPDSGVCQEDCETTSSNSAIVMSNKRWSPKDVGDKYKICPKDYRSILNTVRANLTKEGIWNPEGSEEMQIVEDRALDAMVSYIHRFAWFGDTDANTVGSGYGVFKNGTNLNLFNCLDGLWKQAAELVASGDLTKVTITKNAGVNYAAQVMTSTEAYETLAAMYDAADPRLFQVEGNVYIVTRSIYLKYMGFLEDKGLSNGSLPLNGAEYSPNSFRGIPIIVNDEWDRIIRQYQDNGTKYNLPNRAILTSPSNIPAGFVENDVLTLKSWFSNDDEAAYIKIRNEFDVKLLEGYAAVVAY